MRRNNAVLDGRRIDHAVVVILPGDCIAVNRLAELSAVGHIACYSTDFRTPAREGVSMLRRRGFCRGIAVVAGRYSIRHVFIRLDGCIAVLPRYGVTFFYEVRNICTGCPKAIAVRVIVLCRRDLQLCRSVSLYFLTIDLKGPMRELVFICLRYTCCASFSGSGSQINVLTPRIQGTGRSV